MSDVGSVVESAIKGLIQIGGTTIDNEEVEGLLGKAVVGIAAASILIGGYGLYKVITDSSAAKNVATVAKAVYKPKK